VAGREGMKASDPIGKRLRSEHVPIVYAHRGGAALAPENTMAAFDNGFACGADGIELDVHLSRDAAVVVHHDETLERTTNGKGLVADRLAAELSRLDAGFHFRSADGSYPFRGKGIGIPTLREVLRTYKTVPVIVELKLPGRRLAERVVDEIRAANAMDRVSVGSYYEDALQAVRYFAPTIATGSAKEETRWALYRSWIGWRLRNAPYREFQVPERSGWTRIVSRRFVRYAHRSGLPVKVWTVNTRADIQRLVGWGVDGIITDRPDIAREVIGPRATPASQPGLSRT
jgi:glycerophosphoryl diester phosphodiesterase